MPVGAATGVSIGLRDLTYAVLTSDVSTAVAYSAKVKIIGAITANINPNPSIETLFGDDGPMETAATLGQIELEMSATDINPDVLATLLGHAIDPATGIMLSKSGDVAPWVALGFKALKSNGKYKFVWLLKGKFSEPETKHETKGDKVSFQPLVIKASFVKRIFDDAWKATLDEDYVAGSVAAASAWFNVVTGEVLILVTGITVNSAGNLTTIANAATLQMSAVVLPANASNQSVVWSRTAGTGNGTISATGLLTATAAGTVTVTATATDGSGIVGTKVITVTA